MDEQAAKRDKLSSERVRSIRDELERVISSHEFTASKRCQDFLRLVVEHALAGDLDSLRERMIGAEMFGRPVDYDTSNDAVVRVSATQVRRRLAQYYSDTPKPPVVRIELPPGSYVPKFHWESAQAQEAAAAKATRPERQGETWQDRAAGERLRRTPFVLAGVLAGFALIAAVGYIGFRGGSKGVGTKPAIESIAVLPLKNLSGDPGQDYFSDGMTEELITDLGQVSALRVISRTSAMTYKDTRKTLPEIARELGVDGVVEGSVSREGDEARITAQLIDARTDRHLWAGSYTRKLSTVLALEGEVAQAIADAVRIEVTPQEQARLSRHRPVNLAAQEQYLLGKYHLNLGEPRNAIGYFQKAVAIDPDYAQGHAALANSYGWVGQSGLTTYSAAFSKQKAEALKAIELDDSLPQGHVELANAAEDLDWDWVTGEKELKRALELDPNEASIHVAYARLLEKLGRSAEAAAEMNLALQLDPVNSRSHISSAWVYSLARQYDQALAQLKRASELNPNLDEIFFQLGATYTEKGLYEEAFREFQKLEGRPHALGHLGNAYARGGRAAEARAIVPELEEYARKNGIGTYEIALVYAGLGEKDKAFEWLEKAYLARDKGLTFLKADPCLDPLRSDPRFRDLLGRVGLSV